MSVIPWEFAFLVAFILIVLCLLRRRRHPASSARSYVIGATTTLAVVIVAILLPVKHLDRSVGPMNYPPMRLDQLTRFLVWDWRVFVKPDYPVATNRLVTFTTSEPMTRREVLQKLARETGMELRIGYCGTGATFLFGAHPSFTRLKIPQDSPVNESLPIRSETNRTSTADGFRH